MAAFIYRSSLTQRVGPLMLSANESVTSTLIGYVMLTKLLPSHVRLIWCIISLVKNAFTLSVSGPWVMSISIP